MKWRLRLPCVCFGLLLVLVGAAVVEAQDVMLEQRDAPWDNLAGASSTWAGTRSSRAKPSSTSTTRTARKCCPPWWRRPSGPRARP